jgi:hypothetical protein
MTHFCWWFVDILSRMLEPDERDAVLGDLVESGATGGQALRDVMGFVVRRQAALWKDWHPWLALAGLVGVAGVLLSEIALQFDLAIVHFGTELSVGRDTVYLVCLFLALFSWSWAGGFLLGFFSGGATWLTGTLFCLVIHSWPQMVLLRLGRRASLGTELWEVVLNLLFMMSIPTLPFLLAAIWGMNRGLQNCTIPFRQAILLAAAVAILTFLVTWTTGWDKSVPHVWNDGAWHPMPWPGRLLPLATVSWPVAYMLATSSWRRWHESKGEER